MSVSQVIASLRAKEQANVDKAVAQQQLINELLSAIPADTPGSFEIYPGGYCAQAHLVFEGSSGAEESFTRRLFELYPPLDCVDIKGRVQAQKPLKYMRDADYEGSIRPIFPVLEKWSRTEKLARWWTTLAGHDVEVHVKNGVLSGFNDILEKRYVSDPSASYGNGFVEFRTHALAAPPVRPGAMVGWLNAWLEFADQNGFSADGKRFVQEVRMLLARVPPENAPFDLMQSTVEDARYVCWPGCTSSNPFRDYLTLEQQQALAIFAMDQHRVLGTALKQQHQDFAAVRAWLEAFFSRFGFMPSNDADLRQRILHSLRKHTGLDVSFKELNPGRSSVLLSVFFEGWDEYPMYYVSFSQQKDAPRIKAQDIDVTYVA